MSFVKIHKRLPTSFYVVIITQFLYFLILLFIKEFYGNIALSQFAACQAVFNVFVVGALLKSEKLLIGIKAFESQHFTSFILLLPLGVLITWIFIKLFIYFDFLTLDVRYLYFGLIAGACFSALSYLKHLWINEEKYNAAYMIPVYPLLALISSLFVNYTFSLLVSVPFLFMFSYLLVGMVFISLLCGKSDLFVLLDGVRYIQKEKKTFLMNGIPTVLQALASNGPMLLFVSMLPPEQFALFYLTYRSCTGASQIILKLIPQITQKRFSKEMQLHSIHVASKNVLRSSWIFSGWTIGLSLLTAVILQILGVGTGDYQLIAVIVLLLGCRFLTGSLQSVFTLIRLPQYIMYHKIFYFLGTTALLQVSNKIAEVHLIFYIWFFIEFSLTTYAYFTYTSKVK